MKVTKVIGLVAACAVLIAAVPATASAGSYLSASEAARTAGRILHKEWKVVPGTGHFNCPATRRRDYRVCYTSYRAVGAGCWWTDIGIRKLWSGNYRYRVLFDTRCH
jgi:hypothetical protein